MKSIVYLAACLITLCSCQTAKRQESAKSLATTDTTMKPVETSPNEDIYGTWKMVKCISAEYAEPEISEEEKQRERNSILTITADSISVALSNETYNCKMPQYQLSNISSEEAFDDVRIAPQFDLKPNEPVKTIKTGCDTFWFKRMLVSGKGQIVLGIDGFYLFYEKQ